jgi:hypothetical protein
MSWVRLLANGAGEAIKLVPLVFTLGFAPAHAHLPRAVPVQETEPGPAPLLQAVAGSPTPTLIAQHFALALSDAGSLVRATSVFRNDANEPIAARYTLPLAGTVTLHGVDADADDLDDADFPGCGSDDDSDAADESADAAQFIEAGEARPLDVQTGVVWLEPGDEVTLVSVRPADLIKRDSRRRVVLVLPAAPPGQAAPQFSADVEVDATQPIVALGSATHGGDVDGLGGSRARLFIPNGRVYEARFLSVDFQLGAVQQEVARHWGNEDRLPIAAR